MTEQREVKEFNKFIEKWCGDNAAHLLDSDQNDGQRFRDLLVIKRAEIEREFATKAGELQFRIIQQKNEVAQLKATHNKQIIEAVERFASDIRFSNDELIGLGNDLVVKACLKFNQRIDAYLPEFKREYGGKE